jgi:hypothetical protein
VGHINNDKVLADAETIRLMRRLFEELQKVSPEQ